MTKAAAASRGALRYRLVCFIWAIALLADDISESILILGRVNCYLLEQYNNIDILLIFSGFAAWLYIYINKLAIGDCLDSVGNYFRGRDLKKIEKLSILAPLILVISSFKHGWKIGLAVLFIYILHSLMIVVVSIILARLFSFYMKLAYSHESLARLWVEGCASW